MGKKSQSKPMKEILTRLEEFEYLKMLVFPEETILKVSVLFLLENSFWNWKFPFLISETGRGMAPLRLPYFFSQQRVSFGQGHTIC